MGILQDAMRTTMETQGYSPKTISSYLSCVRIVARHFGKSPLRVTTEEIESFLHSLRQRKRSDSTVHQFWSSLKLFYRINGIEDRMPAMTFRRERRRIPHVLSQESVVALLECCESLKYKTLFTLAYASGLRTSELRDLAVADVDLDRRQVYVRRGKNGSSRYSILGNKTVQLLRMYLGIYRPHSYLFYNQGDITGQVSKDEIRRQLRKLLTKAGMQLGTVGLHSFRHCFATHLMENGTSLFHIMHLLGHRRIETTMVYLHMRSLDSLKIVSPIDLLEPRPVAGRETQYDLFRVTA